ncbi:MAG: TonB-dependent receptor [Gammaproteobacteria bacterium]|nr:TonB-dependent receptor [Gammaproteobacteria bacterium]
MKRLSIARLFLSFLVAFSLTTGVAYAQNTTSSIRVVVTDESGAAVSDVPVQIRHVPTGRNVTVTANAAGVANARGLAVGGPYEVRLGPGATVSAQAIGEIYIQLDETEVVSLRTQIEVIEEIRVVAQQVSQTVSVGVGRDFDRDTIEAIPSVNRDFVSTLATEPQILVDNSVARGPAISMAGQNFRFNSVTIDGVAQNDNFGLSKNASATQRTPISIDAIEAINVNIAPYDVTYGNFIGGNINIVTKSGTNDWEGSVFAFTTDDSMTGDESEGVKLGIGDFSEDTYGFTLGGPIIKDKLFFFANYEKFETTRPSNSQTIDRIAGVEQEDVDRARSILINEYGFDPGPFATSDKDEDEKILLKLDLNINEDHRAVATYQVADGDVLFDDFPEVAVLQSNRYNINEKLEAFSAHVFSNWSDTFSTEVKIGFKNVENRQISVDTVNPDFTITAPDGGTIAAGGDRFRHANELDNDSQQIRIKADWQLGDHHVTGGFEREEYDVRNLFVPFSKGNYVFFSLDDLEARNVGFVLYGNANDNTNNNPINAEANFEMAVNSFYVQDEWTPSDELTVTYGLRLDTYRNDSQIPLNTAFGARNSFSNTENLDGKDLLLPRFGFTYDVNDRLTLRGGAGLFGGGTPLIMLGNSYSGNGVTRTFASFLAPFFGPPVSDAIDNAVQALPDPNAAYNYLQPFIGFNPNVAVDAISPDFEILSTWKYSLGAEYVFGDDWIVNADLVLSNVKHGYDVYEGRRIPVGTAPDGRPIYDFPADGDYIVTNTGEGKSTILTTTLSKTFDTSFGVWDLDLGYTWQDVEELRSYNRFVGFESYAMDPQTDLNNPSVAPSRYEVEHRITGTLRWQKELFGDNMTSVGLAYAGRSGRHYSYVFGSANAAFGGTFLADFGSEGDNPGSQLFYVPTGTSDPLVTGDPTFLADLDSFISSEGCLDAHRGSIAPRNACESDWVNIVSLRLQQEVRVFGDSSFDLFLDIENLGNLINDDWGQIATYTAPSNVAPATVDIVGNQYEYTPNASYQAPGDPIVPAQAVARIPSVYRIQLGLRFRF